MKVRFANPPREFEKEIKLLPGNFTSTQEITDFLAAEVAKLDEADLIAVDLVSLVNTEVIPSGNKNVAKMWQARSVLKTHGYYDTVAAAIAASNNVAWQEAWEYAPEISRDSDFVIAMASLLGLSSAQVDALFEEARNLVV
jgi:hypothetical protein